MTGKGSINHNSRKFHAENTVPERSHLNIEYCCENIKDVYHELFDKAVARYNAKQKRKDRCIDDYYEKIRSGKQEKLFHEIIMQIGNKDDCASDSENGELAAKILDEYMKEFQERNPTLRVFSAHLHMDEATPHLHIDFVPYITESKRGVDTRVSMKQALNTLGFKGGSRGDTELNQWINSEKKQLAMVMERHGVEWEQKGTHEEHLSVLDYKKHERAKEVAELEIQKAAAEVQKDQAVKEAENANKEATKAKKELQEIAPLVKNIKSCARDYGVDAERLLPEPGKLETGKSYREKKAIPFVKKMKDILFSLYLEYCRLQDKYQELVRDYSDVWDRKNRLQRRCDALEERVVELEAVEKDYGLIRKFFGADKIEVMLKELREKERMRAEAEKEKRREKRRQSREGR